MLSGAAGGSSGFFVPLPTAQLTFRLVTSGLLELKLEIVDPIEHRLFFTKADGLVSMENTCAHVQGLYFFNQLILCVGDGDLSFALCLAAMFGVANNIVATSLDSIGLLIKNYGMEAIQNIKNLTDRGAQVIHGVNVCNMAEKKESLPLFASGRTHFDVVTYNFPHAGFFGKEGDPESIRKHTELMQGFFRNAALLLAPGGVVYVAHKCGFPYNRWKLEESANMHGLEFVGSVPFQKSDFPGYKNRRGSGHRAGETFELGQAKIYMFGLRYRAWIENIKGHGLQTPIKEYFHIGILRDFRSYKGDRHASDSKTLLLRAIKAEVARLENLGPEKQARLNSLKVAEKVVPLLVKRLAIHQIRRFQTSRSYKNLAESWSEIQKPVLEAMGCEQLDIFVKSDNFNTSLGKDILCHGYDNHIDMPSLNNFGVSHVKMKDKPAGLLKAKAMAPCSKDGPKEIYGKSDHRFQPSRSYKNLAEKLSEIQRPVLKAMEHEQLDLFVKRDNLNSLGKDIIRHGYDNHSDMPGPKMFGVSHVKMEDKPVGLLKAKAMASCSKDGPMDTHRRSDHGIDHIISPIGPREIYLCYGYQGCNSNPRTTPSIKVFGESSRYKGRVKDKLDEMEAGDIGEGFINWVIEKILCCGMSKT